MFSHVNIGITDYQRAFAFYDSWLGELDLVVCFKDEGRWAAWARSGTRRPMIVVSQPFNGLPATAGNGQMTALVAPNRAAVDRCHALALENGGSSEGEPGLRPGYHPDYYGAYFRDPDGNKFCVVCHEAEPDRGPPDHP